MVSTFIFLSLNASIVSSSGLSGVILKVKSGHGVTANMLRLGRSDSGFESQCPDLTFNFLYSFVTIKTMFTKDSKTLRTCKLSGMLILLGVLTFVFAFLVSRFFGDQLEPTSEIEQDVTVTDNL